jgi:hypothetical protein
MLLAFLILHLLPTFFIGWVLYKCYQDQQVARKLGLKTYVSLFFIGLASIIPLVNWAVAVILVIEICDKDIFNGAFDIHKGK